MISVYYDGETESVAARSDEAPRGARRDAAIFEQYKLRELRRMGGSRADGACGDIANKVAHAMKVAK
jgi:hypothetical protein